MTALVRVKGTHIYFATAFGLLSSCAAGAEAPDRNLSEPQNSLSRPEIEVLSRSSDGQLTDPPQSIRELQVDEQEPPRSISTENPISLDESLPFSKDI